MGKPKTLYHFTCSHGVEGIRKTRTMLANIHPFMRGLGPLVWLTDLAEPDAESVGFGGALSVCDHMAYRYVIETKAAIPWSELRSKAPRHIVETLEAFGEPEHWWVVRRSLLPSEFRLDAMWRIAA